MAKTEYLRALQAIKSLDVEIPQSDQLLFGREKILALPNVDHHTKNWQEAEALRRMLFFAQQAYINTAYIRRLPMIDAVSQTSVINSRQQTIKYINTVCLSHNAIYPLLPPTKWRGVAALGILRIETDAGTREKSIALLNDYDHTALTIFDAHQELYDGNQPKREAQAIIDLLVDYRENRISWEFVINGLMDLPPEFIQLWDKSLLLDN